MQGSRKVKAAQPLDAWPGNGGTATTQILQRIFAVDLPVNGKQPSEAEREIRTELRKFIQREIQHQEARFSEIVTTSIDTARNVLYGNIDAKMVAVSAECKMKCLQDVQIVETKVRNVEQHMTDLMAANIASKKNTEQIIKKLRSDMVVLEDSVITQMSGLDTDISLVKSQTKEHSTTFKTLRLDLKSLNSETSEHSVTLQNLKLNLRDLTEDVQRLELLRDQVLKTVQIVEDTWNKLTGVDDSQSHENPHSIRDVHDSQQSSEIHHGSGSVYEDDPYNSYHSSMNPTDPFHGSGSVHEHDPYNHYHSSLPEYV